MNLAQSWLDLQPAEFDAALPPKGHKLSDGIQRSLFAAPVPQPAKPAPGTELPGQTSIYDEIGQS